MNNLKSPENSILMMQMAMEHFQNGRYSVAEHVCQELLAKHPKYYDAMHLLAVLYHRTGRYDEALEFIENVVSATNNPYAFNTLGALFVALDRLSEAEVAFRMSLQLLPTFAGAFGNLGNVLRRSGKSDEAVLAYRSALSLDESCVECYFDLGNLLQDLGRLNEAADVYELLASKKPDDPNVFNNLGLILSGLKRFYEAKAAIEIALKINPLSAEAYLNLSNVEMELVRLGDAEIACRVALSINPEFAGSYSNLGTIFLRLGRPEEAEVACRKALELAPDLTEAFINLGNVLQELGRFEESANAFESAIASNPASAIAHGNYGNILYLLGSNNAAEASYNKALRINPEYYGCRMKQAMSSLPIVAKTKNQANMAAKQFAKKLDELTDLLDPESFVGVGSVVGSAHPFYLAYRLGNHKSLLLRFGNIICEARSRWAIKYDYLCEDANRPRRERLRMVIVSGHIRRHSVWDVLLHGLLIHLDRSQFEVIIYHTGMIQDKETEQARRLADQFVQGPVNWIANIKSDQPDIVFYPEIGMDQESIQLATLRLAPLQVVGWGHPVTTGLPTVDIFLSGDLIESAQSEQDYCEKLVRLPGTGACSILMPFDGNPPEITEIGLPEDRSVTRFLICQQASKYDPTYDSVYPAIAQMVGPCCFLFVRDSKFPWASKVVENRIKKAFKNAGLQPERYILHTEWLPGDKFWGLMDVMDIYLDTPAFSGYTTAWQALHRGLPVVTFEGRYMRQRLAAGLLRKIGIPETIAKSIEDYVFIAAELANKPIPRLNLSNRIREVSSTILEDVSVVRAFEETLLREFARGR